MTFVWLAAWLAVTLATHQVWMRLRPGVDEDEQASGLLGMLVLWPLFVVIGAGHVAFWLARWYVRWTTPQPRTPDPLLAEAEHEVDALLTSTLSQ